MPKMKSKMEERLPDSREIIRVARREAQEKLKSEMKLQNQLEAIAFKLDLIIDVVYKCDGRYIDNVKEEGRKCRIRKDGRIGLSGNTEQIITQLEKLRFFSGGRLKG